MAVHLLKIFVVLIACAGFAGPSLAEQSPKDPPGLSGPFKHANLAVYFIHGSADQAAAKLIPLHEAMAKKLVRVSETGSVQRLIIENLGDDPVYLQAGDILKGGRQDRVVTNDVVLPPKSGPVSFGAYCVERGRWSRRGRESAGSFSSAETALPTRSLRLALITRRTDIRPISGVREPMAPGLLVQGPRSNVRRPMVQGLRSSSNQDKVWMEVSKLQYKLSRSIKTDVKHGKSRTSLQLSLENKALKMSMAPYRTALLNTPTKLKSVVGVVVVINGRISGADVYAHPVLFRKLWPKLLGAAATEAIAEKSDAAFKLPDAAKITAFLTGARKNGKLRLQKSGLVNVAVRDGKAAIFSESRHGQSDWVHRTYLMK